MSLQGYYNRFDPAARYDELLFRASKGLQSAELNEIQSVLSDRMKRIADVLFQDGAVVRDAQAIVNAETGAVTMAPGAVYVKGAIRSVQQVSFIIPTTGRVQIGVRVVTETITELEDPGLRDPAVGTRNFQEPGAARTRRQAAWGWSGDGQPGDFYPVYTVVDGNLLTQVEPPQIDGVAGLIARYDRESNGNYIVRGLGVTAVSLGGGQQIFSVGDGVANVEGFKIDKLSSSRLIFAEDPDLQQINNEPKLSATANQQTLQLNNAPVESILDIVITAEKTVTVTRGPFSGGADLLPDNSVLSIQSVTQGGTTYVQGTDYVLSGDSVSWALAGAEPAPGSSYTVTYRYIASIQADSVDLLAGTFQITGAVTNTLVLVDYRWKMPRVDVLSINREGEFKRSKGKSARRDPQSPVVSPNLLPLAAIFHDWKTVPNVEDISVRVSDMGQAKQMRQAINELYSLISEERLQRDIASREPTTKSGVFVDPFLNNNLRDAGITQDAFIFEGELQLPNNGEIYVLPQNNTTAFLLPFTEEVVLEQRLRTTTMKINPYMAFSPTPARAILNPSIDQWTEMVDIIQNNPVTQERFVVGNLRTWLGSPGTDVTAWWTSRGTNWINDGRAGGRLNVGVQRTFNDTLLNQERRIVEFLRQRTVQFELIGFGSGEQLQQLLFDGIDITPA
jgi:hypothetical protein